jgi:hypothetical protein
MKTSQKIILIAFCVLIPAFHPGCSLDFSSDSGVITGVVFYADEETIVPNPWVAIYTEGAPDTIFELVQGDIEGRYAVTVPEGNYIALASPFETGPFEGLDTVFEVTDAHTAVKTIIIVREAPEPAS